MNSSKERVLKREKEQGRAVGYAQALEVQERSPDMTGTELYAMDDRIPRFKEAVRKQNMLTRKVGFVCKSSAGRVVRLLQPYDSDVYTAEPEDLTAQYGFVWSDDPAKALPFVAISTSPYMKGNCCEDEGEVFRSRYDDNVHAPSTWPEGWEKVEETQ